MCRRSRIVLCLAVWLSAAGGIPAGADEVGEYLHRLGFPELLAVHLESRLETVSSIDRESMVLQLARLYAELLASVDDPLVRDRIEGKSRALLREVPADHADELRLALLRGTYRKAEGVAERHRLRRSSEEEVAEAQEALREVIPRLADIRRRVKASWNKAQKKLNAAKGARAARVTAEIDMLDRLHGECAYLNAWALYYHSWLNERSAGAREAETLFGILLGFERGVRRPNEVSVDLRATESFARTILGMALCKSLTSGQTTALAWVDLLTHPRTQESILKSAPIWETVIQLEFDDYRAARETVWRVIEAGETPGAAWLRLLAVHAIEAGERHAYAADLARFAVAELAARGELGEVLDLATRYGVEVLGEEGFAQRYIRGVLAFHAARQEHGGDEPAEDSLMREQFAEAGAHLEQALAEADASEFTSALPSCTQLMARCRYFAGEFAEASKLFAQASEMLQGDKAAEALWMAIICLDLEARAENDGTKDENEDLSARLAEMIDTFLARHPTSEFAPRLILKKAVNDREDDLDLVDELLSIPERDAIYVQARSKAAQMLFNQFRRAAPADKAAAGAKFLAVASPLLELDEPQILSGRSHPGKDEEVAQKRYVIRCRQILEVSLERGVRRLGATRRVLENLEEFEAQGGRIDEHRQEIEYRRMQERLYSEDAGSASEIADRLWELDSDNRWTRFAVRAMFQYAHRIMRTDDKNELAVDLVVRHGARVLREYVGQPSALDQPGVQKSYAAVAAARVLLWRRTNLEDEARAALELYGQLLSRQSSNGRFLRASAELSQALGDDEYALSCWRRLVSGSRVGTERWYEARFRVIALLADLDPARAREVMAQHKLLQPDYGPDPWGARLRGLDLRLTEGREAETTAPDGKEDQS